MHAPVRSAFDSTDIDEGEAMIAAAYAENRLRVTGPVEGFRMSQDRVDVGDAQFDHYYNSLTLDFDLEPLRSLSVIRVSERAVDIEAAAHSARANPGDVMLLTLPGEGYHTRVDGARLQVTSVAFPLLDQVFDEPGAALTRRYRTDPVDPRAARQWTRTVDFLTNDVLADGEASSPLLLGAAGRMLAATFASVFDRDADDWQPTDRHDSHPATVRRAVAFIETHPDLDVTVVDIARAASVTPRTLQLAFRRHLDTTLMRYLRAVRLAQARRELQAADPDTETVTAVASRWGFTSSRFAQLYRDLYQEYPSQTLRS